MNIITEIIEFMRILFPSYFKPVLGLMGGIVFMRAVLWGIKQIPAPKNPIVFEESANYEYQEKKHYNPVNPHKYRFQNKKVR